MSTTEMVEEGTMNRGARRGLRAVVVLVAATTGSGCRQLVDDFRVVPSTSTSECTDGLPKPPAAGDAGGSTEFTVALQSLDWGDMVDAGMPSYQTVGLNLDDRCTTSRETSSCLLPGGATVLQYGDGPGGIDNATGQLGSELRGADSITSGVHADELAGRTAVLLRIRGYDGASDDDRVEVAYFIGTRQASAAASPDPPAWDGSDAWNVSHVLLADDASLEQPKYVDERAYVRGGVLVAHFATALQGGPFDFNTMHDVTLTATIAPHAGTFRLERGVRGGRWPIADVLSYITVLITGDCRVPPAPGASLTAYQVTKRTACSFVDIRANGDDPAAPCDALSFGVQFEGVPAHLGAVLSDASPSECPHVGCSSGDAAAP